ncbi:unnamed protein product [Brassica rapa]|uniref:Uncharacterized protein n=1 Tax=Brassica campestris TaxID=3711 RepID=A0A8D9H134_BRACM|nr:unnamed protein product [Brassica rapa]
MNMNMDLLEYCHVGLNYRNEGMPPIGGIPCGGGVPYPPLPIPGIGGAGKASGCEHERLSDTLSPLIRIA